MCGVPLCIPKILDCDPCVLPIQNDLRVDSQKINSAHTIYLWVGCLCRVNLEGIYLPKPNGMIVQSF